MKIFSFLRYLQFCLDFLDMKKNGLIRNPWLISKFMTSQAGQQIIPIHILPNNSEGKDSQTIKFGQLIEYNMTNIFLKKSCTKFGEEAVPDPFMKN